MFTGNGVANNSGKRKVKEVAAEPTPAAAHQFNLLNLHGQHFASSSDPLNGRQPQVQQILNAAAPFKPFSFMSLLTGDDEDDRNSLFTDIKNQSEQIDQIVLLHSQNLRQALGGMLEKHHLTLHRVAEERATRKLKEREMELQGKLAQNAELERMVEHYKAEAERLLLRVRYLERATMSLRAGLQEATAARRYAETAQEEAESSFEDPDRVGPIRLDCKACERQLATVMLWPCRHVCVCTRCDAATKICPVCRLLKTTSIEVYLPLN
ncbi:hypothetical protein Pfo_015059 [Paulownia fortunei]|nr:hypothetical protein Pfo_015059 [Paulownia fortunei]